LYLRFLSEKQVPVTVKLRDGESVYGWIEYFDDRMIRLTREGKPNLFIYKNQIRTIVESFRSIESRRRERQRGTGANGGGMNGGGMNGGVPATGEVGAGGGAQASFAQGLLASGQSADGGLEGGVGSAEEGERDGAGPVGA
jgi:host factor-I protein